MADPSPYGQWVAYAGETTGNRAIYLQSVSGTTPIKLTADSVDDDDQPASSRRTVSELHFDRVATAGASS